MSTRLALLIGAALVALLALLPVDLTPYGIP